MGFGTTTARQALGILRAGKGETNQEREKQKRWIHNRETQLAGPT